MGRCLRGRAEAKAPLIFLPLILNGYCVVSPLSSLPQGIVISIVYSIWYIIIHGRILYCNIVYYSILWLRQRGGRPWFAKGGHVPSEPASYGFQLVMGTNPLGRDMRLCSGTYMNGVFHVPCSCPISFINDFFCGEVACRFECGMWPSYSVCPSVIPAPPSYTALSDGPAAVDCCKDNTDNIMLLPCHGVGWFICTCSGLTFAWQRGGGDSLPSGSPRHVPTEPEDHHVQSMICFCCSQYMHEIRRTLTSWRRGGWSLFGCEGTSGHVPTEPVEVSCMVVVFPPSLYGGLLSTPLPSEHVYGAMYGCTGSFQVAGEYTLLQRQIRLPSASFHAQSDTLFNAQPELSTDAPAVCYLLTAIRISYAEAIKASLDYLGALAVQFFRSPLLVSQFYLFRLYCHALRLRGGQHNVDNVIRTARGTCSWVPLKLGRHLDLMSGRDGYSLARKRAGSRVRGHLCKLWLLLIWFCSLLNFAAAAGGQWPPDQQPYYDIGPGRPYGRGVDTTPLMLLPDVVQQEDSEPESDDASSASPTTPNAMHHNILFRAFGFGFIPEYYSVRLRCDTALFRALELIADEVMVATRSSRGRFIPLMGAPIDESYPVLWVPRWIESTQKRLAVLDATHVSWESSVLLFDAPVVSVQAISEMLQHIWQPHWRIFIPARCHGPLNLGHSISINNGDVIFISPDCFCPPYHDNSVAAYIAYDTWGDDPGIEGIPQDLPWGPQFAHIVHMGQSCLVAVDAPAAEQHIVDMTAAMISPPMPDPRIIGPDDYFHPTTCRGVAVAGPFHLDPGDYDDGSFPVFLDLRGIGRESTVASLRDRFIATEDLAPVLGVFAGAIDGYFLAIKGGHRRGGFVEVWPRCVLRADIISMAEAFSDDSSDDGRDHGGPDDDAHDRFDNTAPAGETTPDFLEGGRPRSRSPRRFTLPDNQANQGMTRRASSPIGAWGTLAGALRSRYVAVMVFFNAWTRGATAPLPCIDEHAWRDDLPYRGASLEEQADNSLDADWWKWMPTTSCDGGKCPGADTPQMPSAYGCVKLGDSSDQESGEFSCISLTVLRTVLDDAKNGDFWSLCDDLAWYLNSLEDGFDTSTGLSCDNGDNPLLPVHGHGVELGHPDSTLQSGYLAQTIPIRLDDALDAVHRTCVSHSSCAAAQTALPTQAREPTVNQSFRAVRIPPNWILPPALLQRWDAFALIQDVSDWKVHPNTAIALDLASRSHDCMQSDLHLYTDGSARDSMAGWAVVLVANDAVSGQCNFIGCFGGKLAEADDLGSSNADALQAEQCALCWACLWALPQLHSLLSTFQRVLFCWDCTSAGLGASGDCCLAESPLSCPLRGLFAFLQSIGGERIQGRHVKAHEGHPWNELADTVANRFRRGDDVSCGLAHIAAAFRMVDWQWAPTMSSAGLPPVHFPTPVPEWWFRPPSSYGMVPKDMIPTQGCHLLGPGTADPAQWRGLQLQIASANVQGLGGKHKFLEDQFVADGFDVVCLQETKTKGGTFSSSFFHRFSSEHDAHWGVAVWIRRALLLNGNLVPIRSADCRVLICEPRILVVKLIVGGFHLTCISAHLPQQAHGAQCRVSILGTIRSIVEAASKSSLFAIGIDANARLPCGFAQVTGSVEHGDPDPLGYQLAEFLSELELWAPATFAEFHSGESATWKHALGRTSRIDFIFLGRDPPATNVTSWVASDIDLVTANEDHLAVAVSGHFWLRTHGTVPGHLWRRRYDLEKLFSQEGRAALHHALDAVGPIPWDTDTNLHAALLERSVHDIMGRHFAIRQDGPRSSYISDMVWRLRGRRNGLKSRTRFWKEGRDTALLKAGLAGLADKGCSLPWRKIDFLYNLFAAAVRFSTGCIKQQIRADKQSFLQSIVKDNAGGSMQQLQRVIKRCGLGRRSVGRSGKPLPLLFDEAGEPISSREALDVRWLQHFGRMEAGTTVSLQQFALAVQRSCPPANIAIDLAVLPTFQEVERQFQQVKRGTAPGLDGLPPELFKAAPQILAKLFHPLMVKASLNIAQPVQWRGGVLFEAYKNSGSPTLAENYRSLFVSSVPGKCFHRIVRNKAAGVIEDVLDPLHCGGRKKRPVVLPALAAHLLVRAHRARNQSFCAVFLDTKSAYYRVVRELAFGSLEDDSTVVALFQRFQVPPSALDELMNVVHAGGVMAQAGLDGHLRALVQDFHALAWFVTPYTDGSKLALSCAGSRPGESWADIVFAFVYYKVLAEIKHAAEREGLVLELPHAGDSSPFVEDVHGHSTAAPVHATWADDSVFFTGDASAMQTLQKAKRLTALVLTSCYKHGMQPNLKRGKSAMLLALRGRHSRLVRKQNFREAVDVLEIPLPDGDIARIFMEVQYTHLGTVLHRDGTMAPEARLRAGIAAAAYNKYGKFLLSNPGIQRHTRIQLFESLVTGVFFNLALWTPSCRGWDHLERSFALLQRRLLSPHLTSEELFHIRASDVAAILGVSDLNLVCRRRRLGFLITLIQVGDSAMWALIRFEGTWARQLCDDLRWLWSNASTSLPFPDCRTWSEWRQFIVQKPGAFKSLVHRATVVTQKQLQLETLTMRTLRLLGNWERSQSTVCERIVKSCFWCGPCMRPFRSKAALATHFFQMHGRVARFRHFAFGNTCQACGRRFRGTQQLALHLRASPKCCDKISADGFWSDNVLPGIGSKSWIDACRKDLGLTLPTDPTQEVNPLADPDLPWEESTVLLSAFISSTEKLLDLATVDDEGAFQFCLDLSHFPLFPDEMTSIADKTQAVMAAVGVKRVVDLNNAVKAFFTGGEEVAMLERLDDLTLEDGFWRSPDQDRPPLEGDWIVVTSLKDGSVNISRDCQRILLDPHWHGGDWPPGLIASGDAELELQPRASRLLICVLEALTATWGWLRAPEDFWASAISTPFLRFHPPAK